MKGREICQGCEDIDRWAFKRDFGGIYKMEFTLDENDRKDVFLTALTTNQIYVGELKGYFNPLHPREAGKFSNFQIDYDKLRQVKKTALNENRKPLIICYFTDKIVIWDLNKSKWEGTAKWVYGNAHGYNYGNKYEWDLQAYLYFNDAIYTREINMEDYRTEYNKRDNYDN